MEEKKKRREKKSYLIYSIAVANKITKVQQIRNETKLSPTIIRAYAPKYALMASNLVRVLFCAKATTVVIYTINDG